MSATFMKNLKKKTVGVACITALTLGTGTAGVVALNAAHAAEASASATTNQARTNTDKTAQVSDFTAKAPHHYRQLRPLDLQRFQFADVQHCIQHHVHRECG